MPIIIKNIENNITDEDNEIIFYKNKTPNEITEIILNKIKNIDNKILYFKTSNNYNKTLLNNNNNIKIKNFYIDIDDLEEYLISNEFNYICIDYYKMIKKKRYSYIGNKTLKYVLDKIEEYINKYNKKFIIVINTEENK